MELLEVNEKIEGFERIDFDKAGVKKAIRAIGMLVRRDSRKKVAISAVKRTRGKKVYTGSKPGEYPRKLSGTLRRSITARVSRPGFMVKIQPDPKYYAKDNFYPAFLWYGVTGKARRQDHKAQVKDGRWRIAPRANYMADALRENESTVRAILRDALQNSLKIYP